MKIDTKEKRRVGFNTSLVIEKKIQEREEREKQKARKLAKGLVGKKVEALTVFRVIKTRKSSIVLLVQCDCGNRLLLPKRFLTRKSPRKNCGHCGVVMKPPPVSYHPEYLCWQNMHTRCKNASHISYPQYGGRGIKVIGFETFEKFHALMGNKPTPSHSIDRIDPNGNYEIGNVRWATSKEQANNKRNSQ